VVWCGLVIVRSFSYFSLLNRLSSTLVHLASMCLHLIVDICYLLAALYSLLSPPALFIIDTNAQISTKTLQLPRVQEDLDVLTTPTLLWAVGTAAGLQYHSHRLVFIFFYVFMIRFEFS
jgi:hypothetical protein